MYSVVTVVGCQLFAHHCLATVHHADPAIYNEPNSEVSRNQNDLWLKPPSKSTCSPVAPDFVRPFAANRNAADWDQSDLPSPD